MKTTLLLLAILFLSCEKQRVEPLTDLAGTTWHWFEFGRDMHNKPVNHYLEFTDRSVKRWSESQGERPRIKVGAYKLTGNNLILTFESRSDTLEFNGEKIYVRKISEKLDFYLRVE